ncbi:WcbI family polysaccharide biosynthesis putative acetyltransferase [Brevundimonas diminuta]|uniref:WcbI family polysaccharide biosynthesis putative acetyltransferase n=1 Tax=Brevundimonas diminuta TaxID=293 RepID=UPI003209C6D4
MIDALQISRYRRFLTSHIKAVHHVQNIVVTSNCQTAGVALSLKAMLPDASINIALLAAPGGNGFEELQQAVGGADVWVTSAGNNVISAIETQAQLIRIPQVEFEAFHPDIVYVNNSEGRHLTGVCRSDYHSYIALWSFQNRLSVDRCELMFNEKTFQRIGYLDRWEASVSKLRKRFEPIDVGFDDFFRHLVHAGPFMHTINHPTGLAMVQLSRLVARKLGGDESLISAPLERTLQDTLATGSVWPVYPAIAQRFGIDGSYTWKIGPDTFFPTLRSYLEESYRVYEASNAYEWRCPRLDDADLNAAMREMAGMQ